MLHIQQGNNNVEIFLNANKCTMWSLLANDDEGKPIDSITTVQYFLFLYA
jgi:hypothetical protein